MPIRISCNHCDKQFSAWDDLVGKPVKCPKCQREMIVPAASSSAKSTEQPASSRRETQIPSPRTGTPGPSRTKLGSGSLRSGEKPERPRTQHPITSRPTARREEAPTDDEFDDSDQLPISCPNCHAPMPPKDDLCDQCGYHKILEKVIDLDGVNRRNHATGFERVVQKHLHGEDTEGTLFWLKITAGFFLLVILRICLGGWFWIAALLLVGGYLLYRRQRDSSSKDGDINSDPVSQALWLAALNAQRSLGWRRLEWPFPRAQALTMRDPEFGDQDVENLENLEDIQVLDFERTAVSNAGLTHLADHRSLQFIVLRRTHVTDEGVRRLQQSLPNTWIWH